MDRERWFQVVMGADYRTDESFTEKAAERIPLPVAAAKALAFDLSVIPQEHCHSALNTDLLSASKIDPPGR
jgi:hypothetical protein